MAGHIQHQDVERSKATDLYSSRQDRRAEGVCNETVERIEQLRNFRSEEAKT